MRGFCRKKVHRPYAPAGATRRGAQGLSPDARAGLSVLESLVALALIAAAFLPMLALQSRLSQTALAIERVELRIEKDAALRAIAESVNPFIRPEGRERIGDATVIWRSVPVSEVRRVRGLSGEAGRFELRLFDIEMTIAHDSGATDRRVVRRFGWRAIAPATEF